MFLKAYNYYPMLIPGSTLHDGLAGNLFSQFSVAATALLIVVLKLNYYYNILFAGAYGIIEELFLALGIYRHNWYQMWMTQRNVCGLLREAQVAVETGRRPGGAPGQLS